MVSCGGDAGGEIVMEGGGGGGGWVVTTAFISHEIHHTPAISPQGYLLVTHSLWHFMLLPNRKEHYTT